MLRRKATLCFCMSLILLAMAPFVVAMTLDEALSSGLTAANAGDLAKARVLLEQVIKMDSKAPQSAEACWKLGKIAAKENNSKLASDRFIWLVNAHPKSQKAPDAWLSLATLSRSKKPALAMGRLEKLVTRYPNSYEAKIGKVRLACLYRERKKYDKAIAFANQVADDATAGLQLRATATIYAGEAYLSKWKFGGSASDLETGIRLLESVQAKFPTSTKEIALAKLDLAIHYHEEGPKVGPAELQFSPSRSRGILQGALAELPTNYYTWWMKVEVAQSYLAEKDFEKGIAECKKILAENPPDSWKLPVMDLLADCQTRFDVSRAEGISLFRQIIAEYPNTVWADEAKNSIDRLSRMQELE